MESFADDSPVVAEMPTSMTIQCWVALARRRDRLGQDAFEQLFWLYQGAIGTYLTHLVQNEEVARDLAQETFLAAWQALSQFEGGQHFRAWLYRIATNKAYSYLHRQRRQAVSLEEILDREGEPESLVNLHEARIDEMVAASELIEQVLAVLSPRSRTCLLLQDYAGFSQLEIALLLEISELAVGAYVSRARQRFRQLYRLAEANGLPKRLKGERAS